MEATISLSDTHGGIERFDIINIRKVSKYTGLAVVKKFLKISLAANNATELRRLVGEYKDGKKRFCIPIEKLQQLKPINNNLLFDPEKTYQPFMPVSDNENGENEFILDDNESYLIYGLVFDKEKWQYV